MVSTRNNCKTLYLHQPSKIDKVDPLILMVSVNIRIIHSRNIIVLSVKNGFVEAIVENDNQIQR